MKFDDVLLSFSLFFPSKIRYFPQMKLNFSFDSIENINRNIHFFDDKLFRQKSEKQKNKQISLLNAFQQNINAKGTAQKLDIGGLFGTLNPPLKKSDDKTQKDPEEIEDPIFLRAWDLLLQSKQIVNMADFKIFF